MIASVLANLAVPYALLGLVALAFAVVELRHRMAAAGARRESAAGAGSPAAPSPLEATRARGVLVAGALWLVLVLVLYARLVVPPGARQLLAYLPGDALMRFLVAQGGVFCVIALLGWIAFPRSSGIVTTVLLVVSSLALVGIMRPWSAMARFIALAAWAACATNTIRHLVRGWAGEAFADWGTSACLLGAFGIFAAFALGATGLMTHPLTAMLAIAVALPGLWHARAGIGRPRTSMLERLRAIGPIGQASLEAIWLMLAIAFIVASGPETAFDSSHRYLPHIRGIAAHHGLYKQYVDIMWYRPEAVQTFMAAAFVLGSTSLAKWLSWATLPALALLLAGELTRRSRTPDVAFFGAAAILSCPLLLWSSTTLYVDHVIVWLCTGAFFMLVRALEADSRRGLVLSAIVMAAAAQSRQNVLIAAVIWLGIVTWHAWRSGTAKAVTTRVVPAAAALAIATAPWYVHTYRYTGNPVFPYLGGLFPSPLLPPGVSMMAVFSLFGAGKSWISHLVFPWTAVFHTGRLVEAADGYLGYWFLALVPFVLAAFALRVRGVVMLGAAGLLLILITCIPTEYARYWLPGVPLLLSAAVVALAETCRRSRWTMPSWLAGSLAVPLFAALLVPLPLWTPQFVYGDAYLGRATEDAMLVRMVAGYPVARDINRLAGPDEGTICTGYSNVGLLVGPAYELPFWRVVGRFVPGVKDPQSFDAFVVKNRIRYWIVERHGFGAEDQWFNDLLNVNTRYWVDDRMVSASGTTAAYWLGPGPAPRRFRPGERAALPESGWVAGGGGQRSATVPASGATIRQAFTALPGADLCKITFAMSAGHRADHTLLASVVWRDTLGNPVLDWEGPSELSSNSDTFERAIYSKVPAAASAAECQLRSYRSEAVHVEHATVEWFTAVPRSPDQP